MRTPWKSPSPSPRRAPSVGGAVLEEISPFGPLVDQSGRAAPRLVSSDASPTRPEWAVTCSTPGGAGRRLELQPHHLRRERHDAVLGRRAHRGPQRPDRAGDGTLHEPDVPRLALLVRLPAADGDQHPVAVGRVVDVGLRLAAAAAPARLVAGREDGGEVRRPGRRRGPPPRLPAVRR